MSNNFQSILPKDEEAVNVFNKIGKQWMLITCENEGEANTMTASWGTLGILWNKPVATVFIRPQRYTFHMAENEDKLSLSFLPEKYRKELTFCGRASGKDLNKFDETGLTLMHRNNTPFVGEAETVMICKKLYSDYLKEEFFTDDEPLKNYPEKDYHKFFICEIEEILIKQ